MEITDLTKVRALFSVGFDIVYLLEDNNSFFIEILGGFSVLVRRGVHGRNAGAALACAPAAPSYGHRTTLPQ